MNRKQYLLLLALTVVAGLIVQIAVAQTVESIGEINAKDNDTGTVFAGMKADLILTLIADMSQAKPGEEIESIQITIPNGFTTEDWAVIAVRTSEKQIPNFEAKMGESQITVVLPTLILLSTVITIEFTVDAPPTPIPNQEFIISLLNILHNPIIIAVKPGNADGRVNNDSFTVNTVVGTKPDPPPNPLSDMIASDRCRPKNGAIDVDPSRYDELAIVFTKPMSAAIIDTTEPGFNLDMHLSADGTTLIIGFLGYNLEYDTEYNVSLSVVDNDGNTANLEYSFKTMTPDPPAYFYHSPESPTVNRKITFDAFASYDPNGQIVSYEWDFGDGTVGNGKKAIHSYTVDGVYDVSLTVTDSRGEIATVSKQIAVVRYTEILWVDVPSTSILCRNTYWPATDQKDKLVYIIEITKEIDVRRALLYYDITQDRDRFDALLSIEVDQINVLPEKAIGGDLPSTGKRTIDSIDISHTITGPGQYIIAFYIRPGDRIENGWLMNEARLVLESSTSAESIISASDVNKDGRVDIHDIALVSQHLGADIAIPLEYNPDVNRDGMVNILDLVILCANYSIDFGGEIITVSYSADIQPIFTTNCAFGGCHAAFAPSGLMLTSYAEFDKGGNSGRAFVAGDSGNSLIVKRLQGSGGARMPLGSDPLRYEDIQKIKDWIDEGNHWAEESRPIDKDEPLAVLADLSRDFESLDPNRIPFIQSYFSADYIAANNPMNDQATLFGIIAGVLPPDYQSIPDTVLRMVEKYDRIEFKFADPNVELDDVTASILMRFEVYAETKLKPPDPAKTWEIVVDGRLDLRKENGNWKITYWRLIPPFLKFEEKLLGQ